jgi:hypothetical protein
MALPNLSGLSKFIQKPAPVSVDTLFVDILGRAPDPGGKAFYEQQLASGAKTLDQIAADLQYAVDTGLENKAVNQAITQATTQAAATLPTTLDIPNSTLAVAPSDAGIASLINQGRPPSGG